MFNNFENTKIVLTSQKPDSFITFEYDPGDPCVWYIQPEKNSDVSTGTLYVNGFDINAADATYADASVGYSLIVDKDGDPSIAAFHVFTPTAKPFDYNIRFNVYANLLTDVSGVTTIDDSSVAYTYDVSILHRPTFIDPDVMNSFNVSNPLREDEASYMLLRTNPKYSGNIKLVVDPSNNLFLDTFKVSDQLNHKKYRRQRVSSKSTLSNDIRTVFQTLPIGEMYRLGSTDPLNIALPKTEYKDQFEHDYTFGARIFTDELYTQKYSLLAPLWLNNKLPDYFAIFKLDGNFNDASLGASVHINNYIENSVIIDAHSMSKTAPIGEYLRTHLKEMSQFRSTAFLSLSDPAQSDPDPNTWYGMAIDSGILAGRSEIPYFFDKKTSNYTTMNAFISEGYERNELLCPNLINLEYVFNDDSLEEFKMARYFGLYLTDNPMYKIGYYADSSSSVINVISFDGKNPTEFFDSFLFDFNRGPIINDYKNRIFALTHETGMKRFTSGRDISGFNADNISEFLNKPDKNIISTKAEKKTINSYINMHINNVLQQGEHFRIINKTQGIIWEVYGVDRILGDEDYWTYASFTESEPGYPTVYRTAFSVTGSAIDQAHSIGDAFSVFQQHEDVPFIPINLDQRNHIVSFILTDDAYNSGDVYQFQRITSQTRDIPDDNTTSFNSSSTPEDISFFEHFTPSEDDFEVVAFDDLYGPIGFELMGDRKSITMNFLDTSSINLYSISKTNKVLFEEPTLYLSADENWYKKITSISIDTLNIGDDTIRKSNNTQFLYDSLENGSNNMFIITTDNISLVGNIFNGYSLYPVNISLLGVNPVKDFDFTVYDSSQYDYESRYVYDRSDDASTYYLTVTSDGLLDLPTGSFEIIAGDGSLFVGSDVMSYTNASDSSTVGFNTFEADASLVILSDTIITYNVLDGTSSFTAIAAGKSEENILDYYVDSSTKSMLKYGLTIPTISKWELLGKDVRGNNIRVILDSSVLDASSNFIPYLDMFNEELSFPVFKYLTPSEQAWESYIYTDINDAIAYVDDSSIVQYSTVKDYMFNNLDVDIFSKIVYGNKNASGAKSRSVISHYNEYKKSINIIISGLNLSLTVNQSAVAEFNTKDWDKYAVSFISSPSRNRTTNDPMEFIINENTKTILIIWYQGNDVLNYNKRYSTYFGGHNFLDVSAGDNNFAYFKTGTSIDIVKKSNVKTPAILRTDAISRAAENLYGTSDTGYSLSYIAPYGQINYNYGQNEYSVMNAYASPYIAVSNAFQFSYSWDTFEGYVDYVYAEESTTFSDSGYNWGYKYYSNTNNYINNTTHIDTFKYIIDNNNIHYYVFRDDTIYSHGDFSSIPLKVTLNDPKYYQSPDTSTGIYMYNGWIRPAFIDILNFNSNEPDQLIQVVEQDFVLSNTNILSNGFIPQYWYNTLTDTINAADVSTANAIYYIKDYNPFKSLWDDNYFIKDSSTENINGVLTTREEPSFFGSKVINLPNTINIVTWPSNGVMTETSVTDHVFTFNISRGLVNLFKTNFTFVDNWLDLGDSTQSIEGYINDTVQDFYNITTPKVSVNMYTKAYDGTRVYLSNDGSFDENSAKNIDGILTFSGGDYIYTITDSLVPDLSYYFSFTLIEK